MVEPLRPHNGQSNAEITTRRLALSSGLVIKRDGLMLSFISQGSVIWTVGNWNDGYFFMVGFIAGLNYSEGKKS